MAIKKPAPKPVIKQPTYKPPDYLSGSQRVGQKYKAWDTFGAGKPDFGKGAGPGIPYHVTEKTVTKPVTVTGQTPRFGKVAKIGPSQEKRNDPRADAIRRRLRGL